MRFASLARTWTALPSAILPTGTTTKQLMPARAEYADAAAAVLPVEAHTQARAPEVMARLKATDMPRSLKEAVGFMPSNFRLRRVPILLERRGASTSGVLPSPKETIASSGISGSQSRYVLTTPLLPPRVLTPKLDLAFLSETRPARPNRGRRSKSLANGCQGGLHLLVRNWGQTLGYLGVMLSWHQL